MTKQELRRYYRKRRLDMGLQESHALLARMLDHMGNIAWPDSPLIMSYRAIPGKGEVPMDVFEEWLGEEHNGLRLAYPMVTDEPGIMEAILNDGDTQWEEGPYGLVQPARGNYADPKDIDAVLVPLLAFDMQGHRLGYGKGYYDRFLPRCRPSIPRVGFSWFPPLERLPDVDGYDIPLSHCVTPDRLYVF